MTFHFVMNSLLVYAGMPVSLPSLLGLVLSIQVTEKRILHLGEALDVENEICHLRATSSLGRFQISLVRDGRFSVRGDRARF